MVRSSSTLSYILNAQLHFKRHDGRRSPFRSGLRSTGKLAMRARISEHGPDDCTHVATVAFWRCKPPLSNSEAGSWACRLISRKSQLARDSSNFPFDANSSSLSPQYPPTASWAGCAPTLQGASEKTGLFSPAHPRRGRCSFVLENFSASANSVNAKIRQPQRGQRVQSGPSPVAVR